MSLIGGTSPASATAPGASSKAPPRRRHTAATRLLANGCDLHTVQRILRHRQISTTTRYLHLLHSDVQEKMRTFSPMYRLERKATSRSRAQIPDSL